jgi:hypothetical protein
MEPKILLNWKKRAFLKGKTRSDEKLFNVVDKVLKQIFGENATGTIYRYLEEKYSLKREDIPSKPEVFAEGLETYLNSGASVVAGIILNESSGLMLKKAEDKGFFEQLKELKRTCR